MSPLAPHIQLLVSQLKVITNRQADVAERNYIDAMLIRQHNVRLSKRGERRQFLYVKLPYWSKRKLFWVRPL
jgi:hypothetical protein